ncbi:MAG: single-stranded DNA-binding protein, partial [Bacilli bacterium]|nr:single-stranded DNA-binding protein [Bacilli bacterium]
MMNRVCLVGRLTAKPELRYTGSNVAYTRFSVAVNRTFSNA